MWNASHFPRPNRWKWIQIFALASSSTCKELLCFHEFLNQQLAWNSSLKCSSSRQLKENIDFWKLWKIECFYDIYITWTLDLLENTTLFSGLLQLLDQYRPYCLWCLQCCQLYRTLFRHCEVFCDWNLLESFVEGFQSYFKHYSHVRDVKFNVPVLPKLKKLLFRHFLSQIRKQIKFLIEILFFIFKCFDLLCFHGNRIFNIKGQ